MLVYFTRHYLCDVTSFPTGGRGEGGSGEPILYQSHLQINWIYHIFDRTNGEYLQPAAHIVCTCQPPELETLTQLTSGFLATVKCYKLQHGMMVNTGAGYVAMVKSEGSVLFNAAQSGSCINPVWARITNGGRPQVSGEAWPGPSALGERDKWPGRDMKQ